MEVGEGRGGEGWKHSFGVGVGGKGTIGLFAACPRFIR